MQLDNLGWNDYWQQAFSEFDSSLFIPARVAIHHRKHYIVYTPHGERKAVLKGIFQQFSPEQHPVVGDWVAVENSSPNHTLIHHVLPRQSLFQRQKAGQKIESQPIAANIDHVLIVAGLDQDLNFRRIERYLVQVWQSQATPVIVLNKSDLCNTPQAVQEEISNLAMGVPVVLTHTHSPEGLQELAPFWQPGQTIALVGSSGVGKSSIINQMVGFDRQKIQTVSAHQDKGRHTTTFRELVVTSKGTVIDTPGMKELQLWGDESSLDHTFADIDQLTQECYFRDCQHQQEPGCAIQRALEQQELSEKRLQNYFKMQRELQFQELKEKIGTENANKQRWRKVHKKLRKNKKR